MSATTAAKARGGSSGGGGRRAGAVLDALVEVPVGVGEGGVGGDDAVDGAAAQLAVVPLVARNLTPEPERGRHKRKLWLEPRRIIRVQGGSAKERMVP